MRIFYTFIAATTFVIALIVAALIAINLDSLRVIGWHFERFVAESLALALRCMIGAALLAALERRNRGLQQMYAALVQERLAASAPIVAYYTRRVNRE